MATLNETLLSRFKSRSMSSIPLPSESEGSDLEESRNEGIGLSILEGSDLDKSRYSLRGREKSDKKDQALYSSVKLPKSDIAILIEHMNSLQKRSEATLMGALSLNKNKIEGGMKKMDKKMATIAGSLSEIKENLTSLDEKVEVNLESIQAAITTFENSLDEMQKKVKSNEQAQRTENQALRTAIDSCNEKLSIEVRRNANFRDELNERIDKTRSEDKEEICTENKQLREIIGDLKSQMETLREEKTAEIEDLKSEIAKVGKSSQSQIDKQTEELSEWKKNLKRDLERLKLNTLDNKHEIQQSKNLIEKMDDKLRSKNIAIDGITESEGEDLSQKIVDLVSPILGHFNKDKIRSAYRLGIARAKKTRTVVVILDQESTKDSILSRITDIKKKTNYKKLWINPDQNDNSRRKYALVKACFKLLQENAHPCSIRGTSISLNGKRYGYEELSLLPENCRPENVKSRIIDDGCSLAFASEHVFCSNFVQSDFVYRNQLFTSVEQAYQVYKVKAAGYSRLADDILGIRNPYYIKKLGDGIEQANDWDEFAEPLMENLMREKFKQNKYFRDKLVYSPQTDYYEITSDRKWGTGTRLPRNGEVNTAAFKGENLVGHILRKLKEEFRDEDLNLVTEEQSKEDDQINELD